MNRLKRKRKLGNIKESILGITKSNNIKRINEILNENILSKIRKHSEVQIEGIILNVQAIIEKAEFSSGDCFSCNYKIAYGVDWTPINGQLEGESQEPCQGENQSNFFVWNYPFEFGFKTTNPSGWPQIVISVSGPDFLGREVIKAYGVCHVPTTPGSHIRTLQMFSPVASSIFIGMLGVFLGSRPELIDTIKTMSLCEGREMMRTQSEGTMTIRFNVQIANMIELGYNI